jgi:hypothetical protein
VRLLFLREFHLADTMVLWDGVLGESSDLALMDYICVSMLRYTRERRAFPPRLSVSLSVCLSGGLTAVAVLGQDHDGIVQRVLRFPPVEDVHVLVEMALVMKNKGPAALPGLEPSDGVGLAPMGGARPTAVPPHEGGVGVAGVLEAIQGLAQAVAHTAAEVVNAPRERAAAPPARHSPVVATPAPALAPQQRPQQAETLVPVEQLVRRVLRGRACVCRCADG